MPGARLAKIVSPPLLVARLVSSVYLPLLMWLHVMMLGARLASCVSRLAFVPLAPPLKFTVELFLDIGAVMGVGKHNRAVLLAIQRRAQPSSQRKSQGLDGPCKFVNIAHAGSQLEGTWRIRSSACIGEGITCVSGHRNRHRAPSGLSIQAQFTGHSMHAVQCTA